MLFAALPLKVKVKVIQSCPTLCGPVDYSLPGSSVHGIIRQEYWEWIALPFSRSTSQGSNPSLLYCSWILYHLSPRNTKKTGVGSLSLLQGIFLTQGLNRGLLHCRQILYPLSYQGSFTLTASNISLCI